MQSFRALGLRPQTPKQLSYFEFLAMRLVCISSLFAQVLERLKIELVQSGKKKFNADTWYFILKGLYRKFSKNYPLAFEQM